MKYSSVLIYVYVMISMFITSAFGMDASEPLMPVPQTSPGNQARLRILVAEDNVVIQKIIMRLLSKHEVILVTNGQQAVHALMKEEDEYDLFLTDIEMPIMDGRKAVEIIRQIPNKQVLPIFALTASEDEELKQQCITSGINKVFSKPISQIILDEVLGKAKNNTSDAIN